MRVTTLVLSLGFLVVSTTDAHSEVATGPTRVQQERPVRLEPVANGWGCVEIRGTVVCTPISEFVGLQVGQTVKGTTILPATRSRLESTLLALASDASCGTEYVPPGWSVEDACYFGPDRGPGGYRAFVNRVRAALQSLGD